MKKPNFFIIGAPKCGTTSMATWLSEHPNIYMSPVKEPEFFSSDLYPSRKRSRKEYQLLFKDANESHVAVGEASTHYLFSKEAVTNIIEYCSSPPRFIVMIRNPVEMAYALHEQEIFSGNEHILNFEEAWNLQEKRLINREKVLWHTDPQWLQYGSICKIGEQLERLYSTVDKKHVHIIFLDDIKQDARNEYLKVLDFLNVADDGREQFEAHNTAKYPKSIIINKAVKMISKGQKFGYIPKVKSGILNKVNKLNKIKRSRSPLSQKMVTELKRFFEEDVKKLSQLTQRDLLEWVR